MEEKTKNQDFLGTEPVGKLLFKLALPAIAAQLINVLYNIVDRVYLGHMKDVGGLALTGVGVCAPILMIISAFAALVAMGGAPLASIELGKQNREGAERIMGSCFALQVVLSLVLTAVCLIWNEPLLLLFDGDAQLFGGLVVLVQLQLVVVLQLLCIFRTDRAVRPQSAKGCKHHCKSQRNGEYPFKSFQEQNEDVLKGNFLSLNALMHKMRHLLSLLSIKI